VRREVLLMRVWGYGAGIRTRTLDVHSANCENTWARTASNT
jgi:DNA-binding response OmpR family regulator